MLVTPVDVETVDPEKEFLQRSQGILTFEDEDDDIVEYTNGTSSNGQALLSASSSSNDNKDKGEEPTGDTAGAKLESLVSPPDASKKRHVSLKLEKYAKPLVWDNALVGISIKGFDIGTSQGVAADSIWHTDMTQQLEAVAQSFSIPIPKRRLNLPEMIYPTAHVALEGFGLWLSWDATDALEAWAKCHQMIAVKSRIAWEGVNVMKAQDAKLWEQKAALAASPSKDSTEEGSSSDNNITKSKPESIFHYDWTFSTPFLVRAEGGEWIELDESGMRTELLKDQTVPILFFDDVILFEDDLHDNGIAHYSIKLRVMPTCAYILARLFIRVDNVILRLRETRVLIDFFGVKPKIYRDVTWKECHWEQLSEHNLPTDVKSWTISDSAPPQKVKEWQRLIELLPEVRLPKNYFQYATFEFD
jgi:TIP41-like family